jgi:hypothetical protein
VVRWEGTASGLFDNLSNRLVASLGTEKLPEATFRQVTLGPVTGKNRSRGAGNGAEPQDRALELSPFFHEGGHATEQGLGDLAYVSSWDARVVRHLSDEFLEIHGVTPSEWVCGVRFLAFGKRTPGS